MNDTDLLTPEDVADQLQIEQATLAAWRRGVGPGADLPYIRVGGQIRYRASDVQAWLDARTVNGA